jgi:hypothetical protein
LIVLNVVDGNVAADGLPRCRPVVAIAASKALAVDK